MRLESPDKSTFFTSGKEAIIMMAMDIYLVLFNNKILSGCKPLAYREKIFFVDTVLAFHEGIDLGSKKYLTYMQKVRMYSKSRKYIASTRVKMVKKKWLIQTTESYDIPAVFKQDINNLVIDIKIKAHDTVTGAKNT